MPRLLQCPVHLIEVFFAQAAGSGLEPEVVRDGVVARGRQVPSGGKQLLLRVQYVDVNAHTDFVAKLVRIQRALARDKRCLKSADLGDAVDDAQEGLAR